MKIEIIDNEKKLVLTDEELDNPNFVDVCLYDQMVKNDINESGFVEEFLAPIDELYSAVLAFKTLKDERKEEV